MASTDSLFSRVVWSNPSLIFYGFIVAGIPTWVFLLARFVFQPEGFWQNLAFTGLGLLFLGTFQLIFLVVFVLWVLLILDIIDP